MNPAVQGFLDKFSKDAEDLIRNVAAFNQLAHIQNHSYKQSTHPCHQKFPRRPEPPPPPPVSRPIPKKKKIESSPQGTQTCQCLYKQMKSTNTEKGRKSTISTDDSQSNRRSSSSENKHPCAQKRPSSMQTPKRCFHEVGQPKSHSSSNKKRSCCQSDDDGSSINSQKSDKCVCKSNHGAPVDIQDTNMEIEEFTDKFYDAQRSLQILRNRIADLNYYMNEGEASKMKMKKKSSTMCPPCPPGPSFGSGPGYGVPDLPKNAMPDLPPVKIKKLIPRNKYLEQGGVENDFSFGNMPVMPPHAVPILPGTFVSLAKSCTPRGSRRSNQRVSFNGCH